MTSPIFRSTFQLRSTGVYSQKKKKLDFNLNEDLLRSSSADTSKPFLSIHNEITGHFKTELAQCLKGSIHELDHSLKGKTSHSRIQNHIQSQDTC